MSKPPFKVRDAEQLNQKLGKDALPGSPESIAILVYNNDDIHDDASTSGCEYIGATFDSRVDDDIVF